MKRTYTIHCGHEPPRNVVVTGKRPNWFLEVLLAVGDYGATSLEYPGVRLSDAVMKLRRAGFVIETIDEKHDGPFGGIHGRYVLRSKAQRLDVASIDHQQPAAREQAGASC